MATEKADVDNGEWIRDLIETFIASPENTLGNQNNDKAWDKPIVGFARGDDPVFEECKKHIGSFYWTPLEIFEKTYPETPVEPENLTVISWVLPHVAATKMDNRKERAFPSERWVRGKKFGELVNVKLRQYLVEILDKAGYKAVAPCLSPLWKPQMSKDYLYASNWSERHAAYAAGLGTFGLCDGLITPVGKAMRCGSIIANIPIPPTKRPYESRTAYCLFFTKGTCGVCMHRCPAGAITQSGHDKEKCRTYVDKVGGDHARATYGIDTGACGLCQTKVPCESGIPTIKGRRH